MDFIEGIGQRYLERKANAVPQQLEDLAKKQFKGDAAAPKAEPTTQDVEKDREIKKLRKELAEAKLAKEKQKQVTERRNPVGVGGKKQMLGKSPDQAASFSGRSGKSAHVTHDHAKWENRKHESTAGKEAQEMLRRGRSSSVATAVAARPHPADHTGHKSYSNSGKHPFKATDPGHQDVSMVNHAPATNSHADLPEGAHAIAPSTMSERPRPATDLCVVEVIDEEPQRRRRSNLSGRNIVEVVEKDRNRTRYIVR
ncbi:MAG: hypothetical protein Q9225_007951 [Loekoesia sp. 1 TL-2023]